MSEEILEPDEAQELVTEYVCRKENVSKASVKVESFEPSSWNGVPVYLFRGKAGRESVDPTSFQQGVLEERAFSIWVNAKGGKIVGYKPDGWVRKNEGQTSSPNSHSEQSLVPSDEMFTLKKNYKIDLKKYHIDLDKL